MVHRKRERMLKRLSLIHKLDTGSKWGRDVSGSGAKATVGTRTVKSEMLIADSMAR